MPLLSFLLLNCANQQLDSVPLLVTPARSSTWISGTSLGNQNGNYGVKNTAAATNVPGSRHTASSWQDSSGNGWIFGGYGFDGVGGNDALNDLWQYSAANGQWTWVAGSSFAAQAGTYGSLGMGTSLTVPGARESASAWVSQSGDFYLFGGYGYDSVGTYGLLNDLWKFSRATGFWTWVSGSNVTNGAATYGTKLVPSVSNIPGARNSSSTWTDASGNLWLFGGFGLDSASANDALNDLWRFNPTTLQWTWISGSNVVDQSGTYGTQLVASGSNVPGAREVGATWVDAANNLWLFGGYGYDHAGSLDELGDLWKFSPQTNQWTWVVGSTTIDAFGIYGTRGVGGLNNLPGARDSSVSWVDHAGNFWLFGGYSFAVSGGSGLSNDLWKFNPSTLQWTWISGGNDIADPSVYGVEGRAATSNVIGARRSSTGWIDASGNLFLFGGYGLNATGTFSLNDLWMITI